LAAAAWGATKDRRAMPQLAAVMKKSRDPRFQVAAGRAILEVLHSAEGSAAGAVADIKD